jgi:hypothetical protein
MSSGSPRPDNVGRKRGYILLFIVSCALLTGEATALGVLFLQHYWIMNPDGHPQQIDFLSFFTAGKFVLQGMPLQAYDWNAVYQAQIVLVGHDFKEFLPFNYPPTVLMLLGYLAQIPYQAAFLGFIAVSLALYALTARAILGHGAGAFIAMAMPTVIVNIVPGQNGFLTAALMGGSLLNLNERPILSGIFLGLLTYKPQFGVLFPLVLAMDGRWRTFLTASLVTILWFGAALIQFGPEIIPAFLRSFAATGSLVLDQGAVGWAKIQSPYGLLRTLGLGSGAAWAIQGAFSLGAAGAVLWLWRQEIPFALKAAGLATGALLVTPYVLHYDLAILMVPIAFLFRSGEFDAYEWGGVFLANVLVLPPTLHIVPIEFCAPLLIGFLIWRRVASLSLQPLPQLAH